MHNMKPEPDKPSPLGTGSGVSNGNAILRVETAAGEGLDELFQAVINGDVQSRLPQQVPMRQRRLPPSFFRPPSAASSTNSVNHSRESSLDGGYQSGQAPATPGVNGKLSDPPVMGFTPNGLAVIHPRANSSPAALQPANANGVPNGQSFGSNKLKNGNVPANGQVNGANGTAHFRQMSYDLENIRLPDGWEMSFTPTGERYFLNHTDKSTTWEDPRKTLVEDMIRRSTGNLQAGPALPQAQPPPIIQQAPVLAQSQEQENFIDPAIVPLPDGWEQARTTQGDIYFISHADRETTWYHPAIPRNLQTKRVQQQQNHSVQPPPFQNNSQNILPEQLVSALKNMNCQTPNNTNNARTEQTNNQNVRDLELERERMRQRQEEIFQTNLLTNNASSNILLSSVSEASTSVQSPFVSHSRQESADSGLDLGNSSNYSMPHTPDDFLRVTGSGSSSNSSSTNGGATLSSLPDDLTFESMQISSLDLDSESMDFMQGIDSMDLLSNVEDLIDSNRDNLMTWL